MKTMRNSFNGVTCCNKKTIEKICLNHQCKNSPFICQNAMNCTCLSKHSQQCNIKGIDQLDQNINTILKLQFFIVYSPQFKGNSIHVAGRYATQTRQPLSNQRFALTYDPIPLGTTESVSFRMTRIKGCVGIGIFVRQVLQKNEYKYVPDSDFLNHGAYMLLSNNMLYSHSNKNENGRFIRKFQIKQNDVIKVKYDKGQITFISKFFEEYLMMDLKPQEHIHFGVYLYDMQDEVELVNTFVDNSH